MPYFQISWVESCTITGTFHAANKTEALKVRSQFALKSDTSRVTALHSTEPTVVAVTALGEELPDGKVRPL